MKIGIDVDGVLADFNGSFIRRCVTITGRDLFPARPFDITTWNYPESYGYTKEEVNRVWESIKADDLFWYGLSNYGTTEDDIEAIQTRMLAGDDVYFVTARPGIAAKVQTERWLLERISVFPTVLISSAKGLCAKALELDLYIDDRWENCTNVDLESETRVFILDRPWNREQGVNDSVCGLTRVSSVTDMFNHVVPKNVTSKIASNPAQR